MVCWRAEVTSYKHIFLAFACGWGCQWPWLRPTWLSPCRLTSDAVLLTSNDEHSERAGYHFKSNRNGKSGKNWSAAEFSVFLNMPCFDFYVMTQGSLCQAVFFKNSNYKWHSQAPILLVFISNILCFSTRSHFKHYLKRNGKNWEYCHLISCPCLPLQASIVPWVIFIH